MQETIPKFNENGEPESIHREFFKAETEEFLYEKLDDRLEQLKAKGHTLRQRIKIEPNGPCPCGSGKKYKKCCIKKAL